MHIEYKDNNDSWVCGDYFHLNPWKDKTDTMDYINPYNSTKFCIYCGTALEHYKDGWLNPEWIKQQKEKHEQWKEEQKL